MKSFLLNIVFSIVVFNISYAQTTSFSYVDPAQAFNKLIIEKNSSTFYRIANYKVIGIPFLYGENLNGFLFKKGQQGASGTISYNTYDQAVEFTNGSKTVETIQNVDSFKLIRSDDLKELVFISGELYGAKDGYYQRVYVGKRYSLYKKYYSDLGVVSTNYIQSDLREFNLNYDYYYTDSSKNNFKKIKLKYSSVVKEFKDVDGVKDAVPQNFNDNPEAELLKAFMFINK